MNTVCPCFFHLQSLNKKQIIQWRIAHCNRMGVLVDNTVTKANNHFGPYRDNEAESTQGLFEIFCLKCPPKHAGEVCQLHCETFSTSNYGRIYLYACLYFHLSVLFAYSSVPFIYIL
jgi:hypothetical protein